MTYVPRVSPTRRPLLPLGLMALTLGLAACGSQGAPAQGATASIPTSPVTAGKEDGSPFVYDGQDHNWTGESTGIQALAIDPGDNNLANESWIGATNGWGPVERDRSNGDRNAGDGRTLTLNGKTYARGFGVHANSTMTFNLGGQCEAFSSDIGVDDEVGSRGSVVFQVYADGSKLYDSGVMTGAGATKSLKVSVAGKKELKLVVTDAANGNVNDHADWAAPMLLGCVASGTSPAPAPTPSPVPTPTPAPAPTPAPTPGKIQYSGPIVITKGGTYSGNWESTQNKSAVLIQTSEPVIIENSNIRSRGNLITGFALHLTIRNTRGEALNPNVAGRAAGRAVNAEEFYDLRVENSSFTGTTGIYLRKFKGDPAKGEGIRILRNKMRNTDGRQSDGNGGYNGKSDIAQAVLFNDIKRAANVEIAWNEIINEPDKSLTEENINMYVSSGRPESPIRIHNNYIQGAYAVNPATNTNYAGGGILLGDGKVSNPMDAGYTRVYDNQIVGTSNHGLAIAGGVENHIFNNRVISSGRLPDGRRIPTANVGLYVWDPAKAGQLAPPTFASNRMENNTVGWTRVLSDGKAVNNPTWFPNCGLNNTTCNGNQNIGTVTLEMEQQEYSRWQSKLAANGVKVGP